MRKCEREREIAVFVLKWMDKTLRREYCVFYITGWFYCYGAMRGLCTTRRASVLKLSTTLNIQMF